MTTRKRRPGLLRLDASCPACGASVQVWIPPSKRRWFDDAEPDDIAQIVVCGVRYCRQRIVVKARAWQRAVDIGTAAA